jgi:hypothetical protein
MGFFWDLYQQSQLSDHQSRADNLTDRVAWLESELTRTQQLLRDVIARLEQHVGQDLDGDGRTG